LLPSIPKSHPWHGKPRGEVYRLVAGKYLRLRPRIAARLDALHRASMADRSPVIAVHVRGTDKFREPDYKLSLETYFDIIDRDAPDWRIFLLTDQAQCVDAFRERYGARVMVSDAHRSAGRNAVHHDREADRTVLGAEVVIDTYMALRCRKFVGHGLSNLACIVSVLTDWVEGDCILFGPSLLERNFAKRMRPKKKSGGFSKWIARHAGYGKAAPEKPQAAEAFPISVIREDAFDIVTDLSIDRRGRAAMPPAGRMVAQKTLIVEGWRFIAHSYALVNQWQLLALSRRADVAVRIADLPFHGRRWKMQAGLFEPEAERILQAFETAQPGDRADVTLRISFPLDFSLSSSRRTAVFGTLESQVIRKELLSDAQAYEKLQRTPPPAELMAVTPSRWSAEGFYKSGFKPEQVVIVPHGVETGIFHPMPELRHLIRGRIGIAEDAFVFLSVGAMTGNKGIDILLRAFAAICRRFPQARLVLKGMDPLYTSRSFLTKNLQTVPAEDRQRVIERLLYFGKSLPLGKMALLYQAADAYVSPYRAEGFNMPVLEAAACGLPVICTRGGATDDFVTDAFARTIESKKIAAPRDGESLSRLEPDLDHLIAVMASAVEDRAWRERAGLAGPSHVRAHYTWDRVADRLVNGLFA
jgi:glycosyltransferase involved in cell wall biosynthesis